MRLNAENSTGVRGKSEREDWRRHARIPRVSCPWKLGEKREEKENEMGTESQYSEAEKIENRKRVINWFTGKCSFVGKIWSWVRAEALTAWNSVQRWASQLLLRLHSFRWRWHFSYVNNLYYYQTATTREGIRDSNFFVM